MIARGTVRARVGAPGGRLGALVGSLDTVWGAIAFTYAFVVLCFATILVDDGDFWWTLALGRATWLAGALPATDPLPYTPTSGPYVQAQWLAGLVFYGTYLLAGLEGLLVLRAAVVGVAFVLLYSGCRRAGAAPALAGLCTLLALPLVNVGLSLRPQVLALLPFLLYLEGTRHVRAAGRALYLLPLVMVVWVNVHGSFLFGLGLVGIALVGRLVALVGMRQAQRARGDREVRALAVLLVLSTLALLVNPYGLDFLDYLRAYLAVNPGHTELGGLATEWLPTSLGTPGGPAFFVSLGVLAAALYLAGRRGLAAAEALRLIVFAWAALRWLRGIVWWGLVLPAPLAGLLQLAMRGAPADAAPRGQPVLNAALLTGCALVALGSLPGVRGALAGPLGTSVSVVEPSPLSEAVGYVLPEEVAGRVFHYIAWGGYLAWRLGPAQRIFVDGRYEAYRPEVFADYARISRAEPGLEARLAAYGVGQLVLSRAGQPQLVAAASAAPGWAVVYDAGDVVVLRQR